MPSPSGLTLFPLAKGGMGAVDLVLREQGEFARLFAVKRLLPAYRDLPEFRSMFLHEGKVAGLLRHPNVVTVLDAGEDEAGPFLVMEYVEGVSLAELIQRRRPGKRLLPIALCARVIASAARGLHAAHELTAHDGTPLSLVHRDFTPQNVLLSYDGDVRVADFGIAKVATAQVRTSTGVLKGKLGYMSPEQLSFREPDRRSDLFALGVVLFELVTLERVYGGDGLEVARRILDEPPPDLGLARGDAPPELVELAFDLLAKLPDDRPTSAREVADRLEAIATEAALDAPVTSLTELLGEELGDERRARRARIAEAVERSRRREAPRPADRASEPPPRSAAAPRVVGALALLSLVLLVAGLVGARSSRREPAPSSPPIAVAEPTPPLPRESVEAAEAPTPAASETETPPAGEPEGPRRARPSRRRAHAPAEAAPAPSPSTRSEIPRWEWTDEP